MVVTKYNFTPANSPKELGQHVPVPEVDTKLENRRARNNTRTVFRQLGFSEGQVKILVPDQIAGRRKGENGTVHAIARNILQNQADPYLEALFLASPKRSIAVSSALSNLRGEMRKLALHLKSLKQPNSLTLQNNRMNVKSEIVHCAKLAAFLGLSILKRKPSE
jgi:hypothetical protein